MLDQSSIYSYPLEELVRTVVKKYSHQDYISWYIEARHIKRAELLMIQQYIRPGCRIIDIGCGPANITRFLVNHGYDVVGVDIASAMVIAANERARREKIKLKLACGDARHLPIKQSCFDAAIMLIGVIQHIPGHLMRVAAIEEVRRVLKPDGVLLLSIHNLVPSIWVLLMTMLLFGHKFSHGISDNKQNCTLTKFVRTILTPRHLWNAIKIRGIIPQDFRINKFFQRFSKFPDSPGRRGDTTMEEQRGGVVNTPCYYHLYEHNELLDDTKSAGFTFIKAISRRELDCGIELPDVIRRYDDEIIYVFKTTG